MAETTTTTKDLGAVFDSHVRAEFVDKDVAATMATMTAEPYLTHVPTMTGGIVIERHHIRRASSEFARKMAWLFSAIPMSALRQKQTHAYCRKVRIFASSWRGLNGLGTYSSQPAARAFFSSPLSA
jgi:hypothetical protein